MSGDEPRIRPAELADLDAVEQLEDSVFTSDELSRRSLRYYVRQPTACFLVLELRGSIVGDAIVATRRGSRQARLYTIAVAPGHAGRGFGRSLLAASEEAARDRECATLRLEVRADNHAAVRFYEAAGYTRCGLYEDYYEDGTDALRFERGLASRDVPG